MTIHSATETNNNKSSNRSNKYEWKGMNTQNLISVTDNMQRWVETGTNEKENEKKKKEKRMDDVWEQQQQQ